MKVNLPTRWGEHVKQEFKQMFIFNRGQFDGPGLSLRSASKELETEAIYKRFEDSNMSNMSIFEFLLCAEAAL